MAPKRMITDAKVIAFTIPANRMRRPSDNPDGERGTILLFTGVRYERMGASPIPVVGQDGRTHANA